MKSSRRFLPKWTAIHEWLVYKEEIDRAFCSVCKTAYEVFKLKSDDEHSLNAFVSTGFSDWKNALRKFQNHEFSHNHRKASTAVIARRNDSSISSVISKQSQQSRVDARFCLHKIFETIKFLAVQDIPMRGHTENESNFRQLINLRCLDNEKLHSWMQRTTYKWLSHDIINEITSILARQIVDEIVKGISSKQFFAFMADETTDISKKEQMSANFRVVEDNMDIHEDFLGFYDVPETKAETLFLVIQDIFLRCTLDINRCRGQCYDGASNMSGEVTGLQTRFRECEPRALYTHCAGHNLNLVSQDGMSKIPEIADFLSVIREIITFIRGSAKRMNIFKNIKLQLNEDHEEKLNGGALKPFCVTRWCVRNKSLKSVRDNYKDILEFCDFIGKETGDHAVKARGFSVFLHKFENLAMLHLVIESLQKVEALNEIFQATKVNFKTVIKRVDLLKTSLNAIRTSEAFDLIWGNVEKKSSELDLTPPQLPRRRLVPKRLDNKSSSAHVPASQKENYRRIYFSAIDQVIMSITERFDSETYDKLSKMEDYATNKCKLDDIKEYLCGKDGSFDFDLERLELHRRMFFDIVKEKELLLVLDLSEISMFLKKHSDLREFCYEYSKFIRLLLTYPQTVVVAERSFSMLKRLKNYVRSTTTQQRTNDLAIIFVYKHLADKIDIDAALDEFISRNSLRGRTFASRS